MLLNSDGVGATIALDEAELEFHNVSESGVKRLCAQTNTYHYGEGDQWLWK